MLCQEEYSSFITLVNHSLLMFIMGYPMPSTCFCTTSGKHNFCIYNRFLTLPILKLFQSYTLPILHSSNPTPFQSYTLPILQPFQSYNLPILQPSNLKVFQSYTLPILQSFNLTLFQSYTLPILHSSNPTLF